MIPDSPHGTNAATAAIVALRWTQCLLMMTAHRALSGTHYFKPQLTEAAVGTQLCIPKVGPTDRSILEKRNDMDKVTTFGPASVGNAGSCYDIMGYSLDYVGDFVTVEKVDKLNNGVIWGGVEGPYANELADVDYRKNTAWLVANHIWVKLLGETKVNFSLRLKLHKYMPVGSGMGSSASSSAAAAAAIFTLLDLSWKDDTLSECLEIGEKAASGSGHLDNVIPAYFGGFYVICQDFYRSAATCRRRYLRIEGGEKVLSVVVHPEISVKTNMSREAVKDYVRNVYLESASEKATDILLLLREESAKAAQMVHAVVTNNVQLMGELLNKNNMLEAARSKFIPHFEEVKEAALESGAYGCTISGSGPAMVAITDDRDKANHIRDAMVATFDGLAPKWLISPIGKEGTRIVNSIEDFIMRSKSHHNFWDFPQGKTVRA